MDEGVGAGISGGHPGKARGPGAGPLRPSEVTGWERGVQAFPHGDGPGASLHGESGRESCELCPLEHVVTKGLTVARPRPCPPRLCPALPLWRSCLCRCLFSEAPIECLPFLGPADSMLSLTAPPGLQPVGRTVAIWACGREHLPGTRHRWEPGRPWPFHMLVAERTHKLHRACVCP